MPIYSVWPHVPAMFLYVDVQRRTLLRLYFGKVLPLLGAINVLYDMSTDALDLFCVCWNLTYVFYWLVMYLTLTLLW